MPKPAYMAHLGGLLDVFGKTPREFAIFVTTRSDKTGKKVYVKVDFTTGGRYDDLNYLIECCLAVGGQPPSLHYVLKDTWDGTLILHAGAFYPGIIMQLVKKYGNKDLQDFYINLRYAL